LYFAFGEHDAMLITEMPDNVSAAAIALAFAAGGALRTCRTTALMSTAEGLDAMRKAATCGYKPVTAHPAPLPRARSRKDPRRATVSSAASPSGSNPLRAHWVCASSPDFAGRQW